MYCVYNSPIAARVRAFGRGSLIAKCDINHVYQSSIIFSPSLWACTARVVAMIECRMRGSSCPVMSDRSRGACPPNTSGGSGEKYHSYIPKEAHENLTVYGIVRRWNHVHSSIYLASLCTCVFKDTFLTR